MSKEEIFYMELQKLSDVQESFAGFIEMMKDEGDVGIMLRATMNAMDVYAEQQKGK